MSDEESVFRTTLPTGSTLQAYFGKGRLHLVITNPEDDGDFDQVDEESGEMGYFILDGGTLESFVKFVSKQP